MIDSKKQFFEYNKSLVESGASVINREFNQLSFEEIAEKKYKLSFNRTLLPDSTIYLENKDILSIQDILDNPELYHERCCFDYHEPDYGKGNIAMIFSNQDIPVIHSHAHGAIVYYLRIDHEKLEEKPDFYSLEYWMNHFYLENYKMKNRIYHIVNNQIQEYCVEGFRNQYNAYLIDINGEKIKTGNYWLNNAKKKVFYGEEFNPQKPIVFKGLNGLYLNEYVPSVIGMNRAVPSKDKADFAASLWIDHIHKMIHNTTEAEILIDWFAYIVQFPWERPTQAPLITSKTRGAGKDRTTDIFCRIFGNKYFTKGNIDKISSGDYQGDMFCRNKIIIFSEYGSDAERYKVGNVIKDAITAETMTMNIKYGSIITERVYAGLIFFSNYDRPFKLDEGDRRFFVTRCNWTKEYADKLKEQGYFDELSNFYNDEENIHGLYYYLMNHDIKINFKGDAPMTKAK